MENKAILNEISLLLNKIQTRVNRLQFSPNDLPDGYVELLQLDVLQLYKKLVAFEHEQSYAGHSPSIVKLQEEVESKPIIHPEPLPEPVPQPQPEPIPSPTPQPEPITIPTPAPDPIPTPEPKPMPQPEPEPIMPPQPQASSNSFVDMIQSALKGEGEPRTNPFETKKTNTEPSKEQTIADVRAELDSLKAQMAEVNVPKTADNSLPNPTPNPKVIISNSMEDEMPLTLADKLRMQGLTDLKKAIPLADKFLYTNELFKGDNEVYNKAIDRLNECKDALQARDLFESMKQHFEWDENSKTVKRFADLLTRKFL